jgi:hypothetical protein
MNLGSILQTVSTDLSGLLGSPLAADFQAAMQQASKNSNGGSASSLLSDILPVVKEALPVVKEALPLVAAFL